MVDLTALSAIHTSELAIKRQKKRNAQQVRLKIIGMIAIGFSALALVTLLWTVIGNAFGAVREHYVTLEVPVSLTREDVVDEAGVIVPSKVVLATETMLASYLREKFDFVTGRSNRKLLKDILSPGASFEFAQKIIQKPELLGETVQFEFIASDTSDLYLKNFYGTLRALPHQGELTITKTDADGVLSLSLPNDIFEDVEDNIRGELLRRAEQKQTDAFLQQNGVLEFERRRALATTKEARDAAQKQIELRGEARDRFNEEVAVLKALASESGDRFTLDERMPSILLKADGGWVKILSVDGAKAQARVLKPLTSNLEEFVSSDWEIYVQRRAEVSRKIKDLQMVILEELRSEGRVTSKFNTRFFRAGDSREPELAGLWGAMVGSFWTMIVTFALAFPIGTFAAVYLEEFAPKNRLTNFVEVNINNLAAVPSIVFGLLGLAAILPLINFLGNDNFRSAPLIGGIVLALMTLPTIIIASRAAIRAVPPSIRDAALGLGASKLQTSFHHVLPLAMPGILTGTIIGMAQALGETAPLLMIGMVAFIVDIPSGIGDSASVLPVQIFRWADLPERAFEARTAAAICVLLIFLILMNGLAVLLRNRFERRW